MSPIPALLPILTHYNEDEKGGVMGGGVVLEEEEYDERFSFLFLSFFSGVEIRRWELFNIERRASIKHLFYHSVARASIKGVKS